MAKFMSAKQLIESDIKKPEWLVEDIIAKQGIILLGGEPASFKSYLALYMAVHGANEMTVLDKFKTKKFKTLIIDEENRLPRLKERLVKIMKGSEIDNDDMEVYFMANKGFKFDHMFPDKRAELNEILDELQPDLIILDSMVRMMTGDENSSKDVRCIFDNIKSLNHGCAWLLLHHTRKSFGAKKGADIRGSGDFMAMADEVLMVNRKPGTIDTFVMSKHKCRDGDELKDLEFVVYNQEDGIVIENTFEEKPTPMQVIDVHIEKINKWIDDNDKHEFKTKEVRLALPNSVIPSASMNNALNRNTRLEKFVTGVWTVKR